MPRMLIAYKENGDINECLEESKFIKIYKIRIVHFNFVNIVIVFILNVPAKIRK